MGSFWKAINETKKKRTKISKKISKEELAEHFRKQYVRKNEEEHKDKRARIN